MKKAVFFDLDGTLLPLQMDEFVKCYFSEIRKSGVLNSISSEKGMDLFMAALNYMMQEHGKESNEEAFCRKLEHLSGVKREVFAPAFEEFYKKYFSRVQKTTRKEPLALEVIRELKRKNYALVLATSPIFPQIATDMRIEWAGLVKEDFIYVTYYENSRYVKPNLKYYEEVCKKTGFAAEECYMVGNSVEEDLCAANLGMELFFLKDYCVGDIEKAPKCPSGSYIDLLKWAKSLPEVENEAV